jgi:restriction system protein
MHENSLFAVLLRSPWWVSMLAAAATALVSRFALAKFDLPELYAIFTALPFFVIGCVAAWKQLRAPSTSQIAAGLDKLRGMSWEEFAAALEAAYRREGYDVKRVNSAADFELEKAGRLTLVAAKRWKATRTGAEPLRELDALRQKREVREAVYVAAGEITENARAFATQANIRLLHDAELAALLPVHSGGKAT